MDADLLVVREECFGSALQHFTGSMEDVKKIALANNLRLNERGVFDKMKEFLVQLRKKFIKY